MFVPDAKSTPEPAKDALPLSAGDVVAGRYEVESVLGAGGVGVVVRARHLELGEPVAIKFLQRAAMNVEENIERFHREARAAARLRGEHVARVLDFGTLGSGAPFMVLEHLDGHDLAAALREGGQVKVETAVEWILQACEGVAEAHGLRIVHRDLKPANLFLSIRPDGALSIKVLDFGISKLLNPGTNDLSVTQTTSVMGSPLYMSPEQIEDARSADERSDIWSLGVILYELLTGKPPFEAPTVPVLCARICTAPPTPISTHLGPRAVPDGLEAIIFAALEKRRENRFANLCEFATALAPFGPPDAKKFADRIARLMQVERRTTAPDVSESSSGAFVKAALQGARDAASDAEHAPKSDPNPLVALSVDSIPPGPSRARRALLGLALAAAALGLVAGGYSLRSRIGESPALASFTKHSAREALLVSRTFALEVQGASEEKIAAIPVVTPALPADSASASPAVAPTPVVIARSTPARQKTKPSTPQNTPPRTATTTLGDVLSDR